MIYLDQGGAIYMQGKWYASSGNYLFNGYSVLGIDAILFLLFISLKPWKGLE
jgi:hypothetical protein